MLPIEAIAFTGSLWTFSYIAYYLFLPAIGVTPLYATSPLWIALFYLGWAAVAAYTFRDEYRSHMPSWRELWNDAVLSVLFGFAAGVFLWALSRFPIPHPYGSAAVFELLSATPWYFVPKSFEILFQQLLIAALVLSLGKRFSLRTVMLTYAILFGAAHLLLFFGAAFPPSVYIMLLAAVASSLIFPYLLLRVRRGFLYCYMIHWIFYAALIIVLRTWVA